MDEDVKRILHRAYERARTLITEYAAAMHEVADALLAQELITGDVVREAVSRVGGSPQTGTPTPQPTV